MDFLRKKIFAKYHPVEKVGFCLSDNSKDQIMESLGRPGLCPHTRLSV
jgi:hypothetical protein